MAQGRRLSIMGLGYVGSVSAGCLARLGHEVVGVDVDPVKVDLFASGRAPLLEPGLEALVAGQHAAGRLRATTDVEKAVFESEISLVCVGTPSEPSGRLDLTYVGRVCEQIGAALARKAERSDERHVVVIRSTALPTALDTTIIPALERHSGMRVGQGFGLALNPEFLREGTAIDDFFHPPKTVIGAFDEKTAEVVASLYEGIQAPVFTTEPGVASLVKYADNAFHATKITFANEVGRFCRRLGVDSHEVMRIFCEDRKLNISPAYLKPGFAFGGSCLPKDLRAIAQQARHMDLNLPMLSHVMESNRVQVEQLVEELVAYRQEGIGVLGLSFKPDTDDLRESPLVTVVESLIGRGAAIRIHDPSLNLEKLVGSNLRYIQTEIPHIASLLSDSIEEVVRSAKAVVVSHNTPTFAAAAEGLRKDQVVFDLARLPNKDRIASAYVGVSW